MNKTAFTKAAKEAAHNLAWPESTFVAGAKWAKDYLEQEK